MPVIVLLSGLDKERLVSCMQYTLVIITSIKLINLCYLFPLLAVCKPEY